MINRSRVLLILISFAIISIFIYSLLNPPLEFGWKMNGYFNNNGIIAIDLKNDNLLFPLKIEKVEIINDEKHTYKIDKVEYVASDNHHIGDAYWFNTETIEHNLKSPPSYTIVNNYLPPVLFKKHEIYGIFVYSNNQKFHEIKPKVIIHYWFLGKRYSATSY